MAVIHLVRRYVTLQQAKLFFPLGLLLNKSFHLHIILIKDPRSSCLFSLSTNAISVDTAREA